MILPRGDNSIEPGDRIVVIGSPRRARVERALARGEKRLGRRRHLRRRAVGVAIARMLLEQGIRVRIDRGRPRARAAAVAEELPDARVFHATGIDPDFLERERHRPGEAAVFAMRDDAKNHYAATLAKLHGVGSRSRSSTTRTRPRSSSAPGSTSPSTRGSSRPRRSSASRTTRGRSRWRCSRATASRSSTSPSAPRASTSVRPFRELPMTRRADRRDRPRRQRDLPARRRRARSRATA